MLYIKRLLTFFHVISQGKLRIYRGFVGNSEPFAKIGAPNRRHIQRHWDSPPASWILSDELTNTSNTLENILMYFVCCKLCWFLFWIWQVYYELHIQSHDTPQIGEVVAKGRGCWFWYRWMDGCLSFTQTHPLSILRTKVSFLTSKSPGKHQTSQVCGRKVRQLPGWASEKFRFFGDTWLYGVGDDLESWGVDGHWPQWWLDVGMTVVFFENRCYDQKISRELF